MDVSQSGCEHLRGNLGAASSVWMCDSPAQRSHPKAQVSKSPNLGLWSCTQLNTPCMHLSTALGSPSTRAGPF